MIEVKRTKWVTDRETGFPKEIEYTKKITLHKNIPDGCSAPRRICVKCLKNHIRKQDKNYDIKICKPCYGGDYNGE